jgi:AcrR family transcriptional regulator
VRERTRLAIRAELADAATRLFTERGFEETTVAAIAAEVGVSGRTFFRYFGSKEDVLFGFLEEMGDELRARLELRPPSETPLVALRRSFDLIVERFDQDRPRALTLLRLTRQTPTLRARHLDKQDQWEDALTAGLAERIGVDSGDDLRPRLYASVALSAVDVAIRHWDETGGKENLADVIDDAFATAFPSAPAG